MSMCQKLAASILFLFCGIVAVYGQGSYTAQIRGTVKDQSGAVLQGATVTITNDATGISVVAHSNKEGLYILTGLRPAMYTLKAEAVGFRGVERKNVVLAVSQDTTIDLAMNPLTVTETVIVTGAAPLLDTESAALGTDVTNEYVRDIPLYNRSLYGLVFLAGGVTETTGVGINDDYPNGTNFVSNGQRNATAEIRLDGSPLSAPEQGEGGNSNVYYQPSVEIVQEFKVQNNSFGAEYGNNGGTVVNLVLKQGGNKFHGTGWWYGQRSEFDSRDYFNNDAKPDHVRDQYGFAVSGPIVRNKTFFFFDIEKRRQNDPVNLEGYVPTDLMRQGNFTELLALDEPIQIFDPKNLSCDLRCPFETDNVIPEDQIDTIGQNIINLYPEPNVTDAVFPDPNFRKVVLSTAPAWQFDVKLDHQISQNHKISGRYSRGHLLATTPTVLGSGDFNDGLIDKTDVHNLGLEYNWAIKPTILLSSRLSLDRVVEPVKPNNYPTLDSVGLPPILAANGLQRMSAIVTSGESLNLFDQCCVDTNFAHTLWTYSSALQWVVGRHSIKFGGEQRQFFNNFWQPNYPTGLFDISRDVTTEQPNQGLGDEGQGFSFATLLTGFAYSGELNIVPAVADKSQETAFFVQDDWKITPKLTVNLGLRYEWSNPYTERFNRSQFSEFTGDSGINIDGLGEILGTTAFASASRRSAPVDRNNWAPRLGFAYQLTPKTVLRGGAGVFYGMNVATNFQYAGTAFRKAAQIKFTKDNFENPFASFADPFPDGLSGPQGDKYGPLAQWGYSNDNDLGTQKARNAEIYQWNLGVQHLLPWSVVIAADYSANRSTHLPWAGANNSTRNRNFLSSAARNQAIADAEANDQSPSDYLNETVDNPFRCLFTTEDAQGDPCGAPPIFDELDTIYNDAQIPRINLLRPHPQFDGGFSGLPLLAANSWYHSLQVRFQKRTSHNLSFEGNYTFSKATDDSSSGANSWVGNLQYDNPQVLDDLRAEHGISANDATHRFTMAVIYDLPFGRGRWIGGGMNRVADAIVGGWSLDGFITFQSGQPIAVFMSSPLLADGNQRPNVTCSNVKSGISFNRAAATGESYINPDCFEDPGDQVAGNAPRHFSNLRGPGIRNLDLSLSKEFTIREDMKLQIRAEMFNATNTPRFAFPNSAFGDEGFGLVESTTNNFRRMQFGARFQF